MLRPLRERMVGVPFNLAHPYWIEDPDFDLDFHLRELALPPPGDERQLAEQIARIHSRSLDRSRPLWELYLIHGLDRGRVGLLIKVHHAAIDGAAGLELLGALLDQTPRARRSRPHAGSARTRAGPGRVARSRARGTSGSAAAGSAGRPERVAEPRPDADDARASGRGRGVIAHPARGASHSRRPTGQDARASGDPCPANRLQRSNLRSAARRIRLRAPRRGEADQGRIRHDGQRRRGHTRSFCAALLASSPRRTARRAAPGDDSGFGARRGRGRPSGQPGIDDARPIPTDEPEEGRRLERAHEALRSAKERHRALPATLLRDANEFIPPALLGRASRAIASMAARDLLEPPCNVVISNVPGPQSPLYCAGARVDAMYPVSAILDGIGLNVTVLSCCGNLLVGIVADREQVADPWELTRALEHALGELSEISRPRPGRPRPGRPRRERAGSAGRRS